LILAVLLRRWRPLMIGAAVGGLIGWATGRAISPVYQVAVDIEFESRAGTTAQASVVAEAVAAVLRDSGVLSDLRQTSGVSVRSITVQPSSPSTVTITLQGYGEAAPVQRAAGRAVELALAATDTGLSRARASFSTGAPEAAAGGWQALLPLAEVMFGVGLDRGRQQGRIDQQVAGRLPAPILNAVRPWYDTSVHAVGDGTPAVLVRRQSMLAGLLIGMGLAIMLITLGPALSRLRDERVERPSRLGSTPA
jgi:hypothetical protein